MREGFIVAPTAFHLPSSVFFSADPCKRAGRKVWLMVWGAFALLIVVWSLVIVLSVKFPAKKVNAEQERALLEKAKPSPAQ